MKKNNLIFLIFIIFLFIPIEKSYSHGWGTDSTSINIDGRKISVSIEIPQYFDKLDDKVISITALDSETKQNVKNVTFLIGLSHNNQMIFRNYFFTPDGNLLINVIPNDDIETKIIAERDSLLEAWYATESQPIQLVGPIFQSGGLFNFEIEIRTIDERTNIVEGLGINSIDVSMIESQDYKFPNKDGTVLDFKTKSYFDTISEFTYDSKNNLISFQMPFDWSEKTVSHIPVVHTEVHFPKNFLDFLTPSYTGKINDIELFKSNIQIDDYTEENERIVHFVVLQDHLQYLKQEQKKLGKDLPEFMIFSLHVSDDVAFPMTAFTRDERYQVDLSWEPPEIEPGKNTKFIFTIRDAKTAEPLRQSTYDFIILQNNIEVYKTSGNADVGGQFEQYTFKEGQTGPTIIRFENIRNTDSTTEFGLVVVPEFGLLSMLVLGSGLVLMVIISRKFLKF